MTDKPRLGLVEPIRPDSPADDIATALRRIADELEEGAYDLVTSCAVVLGHTEEKPDGEDFSLHSESVEIFGVGPRHDVFTIRGLLSTALTNFGRHD